MFHLLNIAKKIYQFIIKIPVIGYLAKMVVAICILPNFLKNIRELKTLQELSPALINMLYSSASSFRKLRRDLDELQLIKNENEILVNKTDEMHHVINHLASRINELENKITNKLLMDEIQ